MFYGIVVSLRFALRPSVHSVGSSVSLREGEREYKKTINQRDKMTDGLLSSRVFSESIADLFSLAGDEKLELGVEIFTLVFQDFPRCRRWTEYLSQIF